MTRVRPFVPACLAVAVLAIGCGSQGGVASVLPPSTLAATAIHTAAVSGAPRAPEDRAKRLVRRLSVKQMVGQRLIYSFDGITLPNSVANRLRHGRAAGVILFARNYRSDSALRKLTRRIRKLSRRSPGSLPALVMIDQEGGPVRRVPGPPEQSASAMGSSLSRKQIKAVGAATGSRLDDLGVNVNLAPVADVGRDGGAMKREQRTFSSSARGTAAKAGAFAAGLRKSGVAATAKHFPGFGSATVNTDQAPTKIYRSHKRRQRELRPFRELAADKTGLMMLSTAIYPRLSNRPAALARPIAGRLLRRKTGFDGVSITDALDTPTLDAFGNRRSVAKAAFKAQMDLLLYAHSTNASDIAARVGLRAARSGDLKRVQLRRTVVRVLTLRYRMKARDQARR